MDIDDWANKNKINADYNNDDYYSDDSFNNKQSLPNFHSLSSS